jgi:hypothetical protein
MKPQQKVKLGLDETRLLILGSQILFGFSLQSVFRPGFEHLSHVAQYLSLAALFLMAFSVALLIVPSLYRELAADGEATAQQMKVTSLFAGLALVPFLVSLGLLIFVVFEHAFGQVAAIAVGLTFCALGGFLFYGLGLIIGVEEQTTVDDTEPTPLSSKVEQTLTEARVIIPGAQALLGFQLIAILTESFERLAPSSKLIHGIGLCCVALSVILLMTPAALHRLSFGGDESPQFLRIASLFITAATVPLAAGLACDLYVVGEKIMQSTLLAAAAAAGMFVVNAGLWYGYPLLRRGIAS